MPAPLDRLLHPVDISPYESFAPPPNEEKALTPPTFASYKRVPKACTQCRCDKTRCDKARPCNGCIKRGRAHLCLDGCVACRRARLRCDGSRPCATCVEQGRECVEDDPHAIAAARSRQSGRHKPLAVSTSTTSTTRASTTPSPTSDSLSSTASTASTDGSRPRPRPKNISPDRHPKTSCVACKRDSKECPGGVPCPHCMQGGEQCVYVSRGPKLVKQRCAMCRKKNKKCEEARPCLHCVKAGADCIDLPRKGTGPGLRVKRACVGCRTDKIQCEEVRPCAGCNRKKIQCVARGCKTCAERGTKCSSCVRQAQFHFEQSPSEESDSDWEDLSTPPVHSSTSSTSSRAGGKRSPPFLPPIQRDYVYPLPQIQSPTFYGPHTGPKFPPPGPPLHPLRAYPFAYTPHHSLFVYTDSPRPLSLDVSMSDIRTRPAHITDE